MFAVSLLALYFFPALFVIDLMVSIGFIVLILYSKALWAEPCDIKGAKQTKFTVIITIIITIIVLLLIIFIHNG